MKKIVQILGLLINLFIVKILTSYSKQEPVKIKSKSEDWSAFSDGLMTPSNHLKGEKNHGFFFHQKPSGPTQTLKRITQLQMLLYKVFNIQKIIGSNKIEKNISKKDGMINITQGKMIKNTFILLIAGVIIKNQENKNKVRKEEKSEKKEKYIILLTNQLGITVLINSNDWILTIISWELFNMSQYLLVSLKSESESGMAASLKYFVLSAQSTAFLLQGVCMLYYQTGSTHYEIIETSLRELNREGNEGLMIQQKAFAFILQTLLFKLSAAPFYQWAPDQYENIETKITKWMIIVPKQAVLSFIYVQTKSISYFMTSVVSSLDITQYILLITGSQSQVIGSIAQNNQWLIKRFFAYSGISHVGFMQLALYSLENQGFIFYMLVYGLTTINIFTIFIKLSEYKGRDLKKITDLSGIFKQNPVLSVAQALNLFSLAGVCLL